MDVFTWSLPFVFEKVHDMLGLIVQKCSNMFDEDDEESKNPPKIKKGLTFNPQVMRHKIMFISKMRNIHKQIRERHEKLI